MRVRPVDLLDDAHHGLLRIHVEDGRGGVMGPRGSGHSADHRDHQQRLHSSFAGASSFTPAFPWASRKLRLFSSQMYSRIVQSRCRASVLVVVHGFASASGSITVVSTDIVSGPVSRNRSDVRILSLCGVLRAIVVSGENPTVSTTSVSRSQRPIEVPLNVGSGSAGSERPSV